MSHRLHLLNLPDIVLEKVFLFMSYDEIARLRVVSKRFDCICRQLLNKGFIAAERYHAHSLKAVKVQLPRRESERRLHPLSRHCDILTAIETRLSMLSMTFMKYIDTGFCCFIPGKVIDEIFRVLRYLKESTSPPRAHEILQELRDISSMAMEHFDEKIAPDLKSIRQYTSTPTFSGASAVCGDPPRPIFTQERLQLELMKFKWREQRNRNTFNAMRTKLKQLNVTVNLQARKIHCQASRLADQDNQIGEVKRVVAELEHKFGDVIAELSCVREENAVLAASLGIVFNQSASPQVQSRIKSGKSHTDTNRFTKMVESNITNKSDEESSSNETSRDVNKNQLNVCSVSKVGRNEPPESQRMSLRSKRNFCYKSLQRKFNSINSVAKKQPMSSKPRNEAEEALCYDSLPSADIEAAQTSNHYPVVVID